MIEKRLVEVINSGKQLQTLNRIVRNKDLLAQLNNQKTADDLDEALELFGKIKSKIGYMLLDSDLKTHYIGKAEVSKHKAKAT
jgi:hypothetical protein